MAEAPDLLRLRAAQDVDDMRRAEALAGPVDRRQDLPRVLGAVDALRRIEADIAVAAGLDPLPEILQQRRPPAGRRLAIAEQRVETLVLAALAVGPRILVLDELPAHPDVREPVEHVRLGRPAVAPGAADLLVVGLDAARQVGMEDVAHVGLVDPHAEGDRGDDDHARLGHEKVLVRLAVRRIHAGVVGQRPDPVRGQQRRGLFGLPARQAVDDAALAVMAGDEVAQLPFPVPLHRHRQADVGPVEAEHELLDLAAEQLVHDVVPGHLVGGRRQRGERNAGKERPQPA